ncbi:hypothetical protein Sango_2836700 [Sesamum angolense]|uniref:Transposase MuDR plant domain-containing protein n=1 Tax=Sesamum angolense TaxID=2727404 RepID=A0AAE1T786_9LAMI|nr:hypothetical protein Sango_2836700 [Sesamum angolense]
MVYGDYADFFVWLGGVIEWVHTIRYVGGYKVFFPGVDKERLFYDNLITTYTKAGGKGDEEGIGAQNEGVGVEEGIEEGVVGENESVGLKKGLRMRLQGLRKGLRGIGVENEVQNDESESNPNSSLVSDCPSWMLEDLEGPWDDDIFTNRPENYTRTMLKTLSDCEDEELKSVRGSDDEGDGCPVWDERMNMGKVNLAVGMKFETRAKFRDVMRDWAVRRGWDLKLVKNEKHLILATCKNECNWKLRASSVMKSTTFQIKSIKGKHICAHKVENKQANYKYIGKRFESFVRDNPNESLQPLKNKVRRELQIEVSDYKVYRAKKYALELIRGDVKEQYARLYDYCHTVVKHNPGSSLIMKLNKEVNPLVLERMYFCLKGMRDGFIEGCRPLIGLDGCFLKGLFKGSLLAAIGRDPNDNIYPIAVAYVEVEKYDSWEWFLNLLLRDIGSHNERGWAFISDRQKGLLEAIVELAPGAEHRFCLRHILPQGDVVQLWHVSACGVVMPRVGNFNPNRKTRPYGAGTSSFSQPSQDSQPQVPVQPHVPAHDPPPQTAPRNPFKISRTTPDETTTRGFNVHKPSYEQAVHSKKTTQQSVQQQHPQSSGVHQVLGCLVMDFAKLIVANHVEI